jgi:hypothetical protein
MATTDVPYAQRLGREEVRPEARCARPRPAAPALTVSGESALFYLWFGAGTRSRPRALPTPWSKGISSSIFSSFVQNFR